MYNEVKISSEGGEFMWHDLAENERSEYKKMILAFASLTEMFAQKNEVESDESEESPTVLLSPIINSKYQETVFQRAFNASAEDIGNTSYDAAIEYTDEDNKVHRYLVGIKTFGISSGQQKVAQFKANHNDWANIINNIWENSVDQKGIPLSKAEINRANQELYLELAIKISNIRNKRILSSEANLRGFDVHVMSDETEAVYHVLMPSKKGEEPYIYVGETSYNKIDTENIEILGCTSARNPTNFEFTDGKHKYRYTSADSQLLMDFDNQHIVQEKWKVKYATDAYAIFSEIADKVYNEEKKNLSLSSISIKTKKEPIESYSWMITNSKGEVERYSGFNGFYGVGAKNKKTAQQIDDMIAKLREKYLDQVDRNILDTVLILLRKYLITSPKDKEGKLEKEELRNQIVEYAKTTRCDSLLQDVYKNVFRPVNEMYIPFPNSRKFHQDHPDFFGPGIGALVHENGKWKLAKSKEQRCFTMAFEPSGDEMEMFIGQDAGKAIESKRKQSILGEWMMEKVFMLDKYEPLTANRLNEIGINGIRLSKYQDDSRIHLSFIWIDSENPPQDLI